MPYYPTGKELENACKKLRLYSVCAECGGGLELRYDMDEHRDVIYCKGNREHEGIRKTWADTLKKIRGEFSMDSVALMKLGEDGMLARIKQAKFPQALKPEEEAMVAEIALSYGLDPIMNELSIYQGRPYPTVNAWYRKSQETGHFDGMNSRPATEQERKERNANEGDYLYCVEVWRKGSAHPFVGWGRVTKSEIEKARAQAKAHNRQEDALPIVKDPDRMAEKRGEMAGMRKAFSIPMPPISFEEAIESEVKVTVIDTPSGKKVRTATGEVVEDEQHEEQPTEIPVPEEAVEGVTEEEPPTESGKDRQITDDEITELRIALKDKGKDMTWLGNLIAVDKKWGVRDLKKLTLSQLGEIYEELKKL